MKKNNEILNEEQNPNIQIESYGDIAVKVLSDVVSTFNAMQEKPTNFDSTEVASSIIDTVVGTMEDSKKDNLKISKVVIDTANTPYGKMVLEKVVDKIDTACEKSKKINTVATILGSILFPPIGVGLMASKVQSKFTKK
ncbi:MAG: hypothetical protein ACRC5M_07375 [Anaeroplasmataceae bacterium]